MLRVLIAALLGAFFMSPVWACPTETQETRITEIITADDHVSIIAGADLDLFVKNANDLWNIGWQRPQIAKIYVIEAEYKAENPLFQVVHMFFVSQDGCIVYYQTTYAAVVQLLMSPHPMEIIDPSLDDPDVPHGDKQ